MIWVCVFLFFSYIGEIYWRLCLWLKLDLNFFNKFGHLRYFSLISFLLYKFFPTRLANSLFLLLHVLIGWNCERFVVCLFKGLVKLLDFAGSWCCSYLVASLYLCKVVVVSYSIIMVFYYLCVVVAIVCGFNLLLELFLVDYSI